MGKQQRKTRLNKGESGDFIGFGAFANAASVAATTPVASSSPTAAAANTTSSSSSSSPSLTLSPVYIGNNNNNNNNSGGDDNNNLSILFSRIGQKRDAITKTKALLELKEFFLDTSKPKKLQVDALCHFLYLFYNKLYYESTASVRTSSIEVCDVAKKRVPKAWKTLTTTTTRTSTSTTTTSAAAVAVAAGGQPQILGMILCSRSDPSADVRLAANGYFSSTELDENYELGLWTYSQRILSYGKAMNMHEALFQKASTSTSASSSSSSSSTLSDKQKEEAEERYNRIVSTTLGGVRLFLLLDNNNNDNNYTCQNIPDDVKFLWKTIANPKPSLRLQTYTLLSVACQKIPNSLNYDKLSKLLQQSLGSEKVAANIPALLESLLSFVANMSSSSEEEGKSRTEIIGQYTKALTKLFKKGCYCATDWSPMVLPIVALLPPEEQPNLLTSIWEGRTNLVGLADTFKVVEAVGETATFLLQRSSTNTDFAEVIATCWFECFTTYLRHTKLTGPARHVHQHLGKALANDIYQLDNATTSNATTTATTTTFSSPLIVHLHEWFWNDKLVEYVLKPETGPGNLAVLLENLLQQQQQQQQQQQLTKVATAEASASSSLVSTSSPSSSSPHYMNALIDKFHEILKQCQGSSGLVPTKETYTLWIVIMKHVPISKLFVVPEVGGDGDNDQKEEVEGNKEIINNNDSLEHFISNDLLRWLVIHTSNLSEQADEQLTKLDIELFWYCCRTTTKNGDDDDKNEQSVLSFKSMWTSILRELIAAKCDLQYLAMGCLVRLVELGCPVAIMKSRILDDLSIQVANEAVEHHHHHIATNDGEDSISHASSIQEAVEVYHRKTCNFLQACSGLGGIDDSLVGQDTVDKWTEIACPNDSLQRMELNPVLETLVALAQKDKLGEKNLHKTILQCWRQGDDNMIWENQIRPWMLKDGTKSDVATQFVLLASKELTSIVRQISSESKFNQQVPIIWADRAFRLLDLCCCESIRKIIPPCLSLVGLADLALWQRKEEEAGGSFIAKCLLLLLNLVEKEDQRWVLFSNSDVDTDDLIVQILMSLSSASTSIVNAGPSRRRRDACAELLSKLGGGNLTNSHVKCISILSAYLRSKAPESRICRGIAVLSQLLELHLLRLRPATTDPNQGDDTLQVDRIKKGDFLFYIPDPEEPSKREPCAVVKIHTDLPEEVYFTIQTERDGTPQERQTVISRLREKDNVASTPVGSPEPNVKDGFVSLNTISSDEVLLRENISKLIVDELVTPHWDTWSDLQYEILNILISHSGLLGERGVGTVHFKIMQRLNSMHGALRGLLASESEKKEELISSLQRLSLSLGFGWNTPPSREAMSILGFSANDSLEAITEYYDESGPGDDSEIDEAVASFLAVAGRNVENAELREKVHATMFQLTADLFESCSDNSCFVGSDLVAVRVMHAAQVQSHATTGPGQSVIQDDEAEAIKGIVNAYASRWENATRVDSGQYPASEAPPRPLWASLPVVNSVIRSSLNHRSALTAAAARCSIDSIISCLLHPCKCSVALRLIQAYVNEGIPLHKDVDNAINEATAKRLQGWSKSLVTEEAEELEEDVELVAQWVPKQLMNDIESWDENSTVDGEHEAFGRMALWLVFLYIADTAARKGNLIRPALTSYIRYCKSADAALDLAVSYGNVGSDGRLKLDGTAVADITQLFKAKKSVEDLARIGASSVVFRTVEVLPTLAKTWWEVTCPGYCSQAVKDFVESTVSPQILRRELDRMKRYTAFGDMTVRGSAVSREITALYKQDDFTLTVIVKLPPSFPFARAEVDCSKTLGVPEQRSKRWSLQISLMLNNQGGTLIDALILWKENVDKEFEGVEPCPICYSVLHVKTHKLPEMQCKTCSNRFHFDCLTQWFRSSGKSVCVLCQQPWSGTRVT